jgi:hypothetical protein
MARNGHSAATTRLFTTAPRPWWPVIALWSVFSVSLAGACPDLAQAPQSQWRTVIQDDVHWLLTPCGDRFFSIGINSMEGGQPTRLFKGGLAYHWGAFYPDLESWARHTRERVLSWGFNTAGGWSLHPRMLRLPVTPNLELGRQARFHWFDPLHPESDERMRLWAHRLVAPYKDNPYRIGYFTDNEVGWWNGALFLYFLKQPATNYTKQRLVTLLREHYDDNWERFTGDFVPPDGVASFTQLLHSQDVFPRLRPGGNGIQVVRRWTGIITEHYYRLSHDALREADPQALIFGDRLPIYYDPVAVRTMAPYVDVITTNYNVDSPDGWIARYFFDGLRQLTGEKPVLISEWFFAAHENRSGNRNTGHLMTVQTQAQRARGAAAAAQRLAAEPNLVGLHWFQYHDHPTEGRDDGENYNFGLVDIHDRPYEQLIDALSRVNHRASDIHLQARPWRSSVRASTPAIPKAAIDVHDRSLAEWPKAQTLLSGFVTPAPEVIFADVYMAWNSAGLYLALIGMDYYDPDLLAYDGEFPLEEAFRVDWGIDAGAGPQRFALYIIPPTTPAELVSTKMRGQLCRTDRGACQPVPGAVATYFGSEQPRITVEVSLPWQALGVNGPPPGGELRMTLAATAWHRSRWMSWNGLLPEAAMQDPARWSVITLGNDSARPSGP